MRRVIVKCDQCGKDCGDTYFEIWRHEYNGLDYNPFGKSDYCVSCFEKLTDYGKLKEQEAENVSK